MKFDASVYKINTVTKKEADLEKNYLQINILVPLEKGIDVAEYFEHYRNVSRFTMEPLQGDLLNKKKK